MKKPDIYQIVTILLSLGIVIALGFFVFNLAKGKVGKAALSIDSVYNKAAVLVNGKSKGETPVYTEEIRAGNLKVDINGETNSYSTIIKPAPGTQAVINRDLGINTAFSSGQNLWFAKIGGSDQVFSVISPDVNDVSVIVDGVEMGKTPKRFSVKDLLSKDENNTYTLSFRKDGYEEQEAKVEVREGYELNIRVDMFLKPIPNDITTLSGLPEGVQFINFSKASNSAFTDRQAWANGINYWLNTRGAAVLGNYKVEKFAYFVTDNGDIYNDTGNSINPSDVKFEKDMFIAYLGSDSAENVSDQAKDALSKIGEGVSVSAGGAAIQIKIKPTGLGFLRVRSGPGTGNAEVGRVDEGKTFAVLEEKSDWYKIEYETGKEGWISSVYAEKL